MVIGGEPLYSNGNRRPAVSTKAHQTQVTRTSHHTATMNEGTRAALTVKLPIKKNTTRPKTDKALPKGWTAVASRSKTGQHWYSHTSGLKTWKRPKEGRELTTEARENCKFLQGAFANCPEITCMCAPTNAPPANAPIGKYAVLGKKRLKYRSVKSAQEQLESDVQYDQLATLLAAAAM